MLDAAIVDSKRREILGALCRLGLISKDQTARMTALAGGVSSDIWRVDLPDGPVCVKRALPQLKVEARWQVPVERNIYEHAWIDTVSRFCPQAVPRLVGHDPTSGLFVMAYLDPSEYPVWKAQLLVDVPLRLLPAGLAQLCAPFIAPPPAMALFRRVSRATQSFMPSDLSPTS